MFLHKCRHNARIGPQIGPQTVTRGAAALHLGVVCWWGDTGAERCLAGTKILCWRSSSEVWLAKSLAHCLSVLCHLLYRTLKASRVQSLSWARTPLWLKNKIRYLQGLHENQPSFIVVASLLNVLVGLGGVGGVRPLSSSV